MNADTAKTNAGTNPGLRKDEVTFATYTPVPNPLHVLPNENANIIRSARDIIPPAPLSIMSIISFIDINLWKRYITPATAIANITDQKTAVEPEPWVISPFPVIINAIGIAMLIITTGTTRFRAKCFFSSIGCISMTVSSISGTAPSLSNFPSFTTRFSAFFIAPRSNLKSAISNTINTATIE